MPQNDLPVTLPQICAPREGLLDIFDERAEKQCVYIHASAGYGKTISTLLWLNRANRTFAWLFLDEYDNILSLFYRSLCRCLLAAASPAWAGDISMERQFSELEKFISSPAFGTAPVENTMELISMLSWRKGKYALALDDLHNITNEEILKSLPYVLKRLPPSVNTLLLSREALPDAMRVIADNTGFIGSRELMFTPEEIRRHFISYGWFVSMERAADIHSYTDGWVIILNAMVLSGEQRHSYKEHKPTLEEFFEKNIWNGFDEATQQFLLKTSVVDSFTLELCERLTGNDNSAETLNMMIRGNISLTHIGAEFRYHNLFLEFLRERLEKSEISSKDLYYTAARYYLEKNEFHKAASYALFGANAEIDMQIIQNFFESKTPTLDQYYELARVYDINKFSDEICAAHPILCMPNILSALLAGDIENTKRFFDLFYKALPNFVTVKHPIADVAVTRLILDYRVGLADFRSFMDSLHIGTEKRVPGQVAIVTMQMPFLHRSNRDYSEFLNPNIKDALQGLFACLLPNDCDIFLQSVTAGLLMEQNRLSDALDTALATYESLMPQNAVEIIFGVSVCLAELYSLKSNKEQSRIIIERLRQLLDENRAPYLLKNLTAYEERQKLWDGDTIAARNWFDNYFVSESTYGEFHKIYQSFTTVRAYIVLSEPSKAMAVLDRLYNQGAGMNRLLDKAEADVLTAIVQWITGKKKEARDRLHLLLIELHPHGFVRVVANEGKAVLPILTSVIKQLDKAEEKDEALRRFVKEIYVAAYERSKHFKGLTCESRLEIVKLSPKQTLVLELLSKGHSNAEITQSTGLSINTIREHTRVAYQKLEVRNVMDAIAKAKQLGILK